MLNVKLTNERAEHFNSIQELNHASAPLLGNGISDSERLRLQALHESRKLEIARHQERIAEIDREMSRLYCRA